jgi:hypothetical protein
MEIVARCGERFGLHSPVKPSPLYRAVRFGFRRLQFDAEITCGSRKSTTPLVECHDIY